MALNYDGMNGSEMDTSDSRKRPLDGETDNGVTKRSNQGGGTSTVTLDDIADESADSSFIPHPHHDHPCTDNQDTILQTDASNRENIHLKILVPSIAAGAIIGKGGETIAQIQKEAGARVKMSKANDFYPGTTERVCLIMGPMESVRRVHNFIMEKIREKPDPNPKMDETKTTFERHRQVEVKILVPNSTAGMIIGKAGNFIKQIKEESGAYVQISQKSKETNLPERCVTVAGESTGDMESNRKAMEMILQKIVEDPQSGSCPNISYQDYSGPVASANPTGSPFANTTFIQNRSPELTIGNNNFAGGGFSFGINGNTQTAFNPGINFNLNTATVATPAGTMSGAAIDNLKLTLRNSGFTDQATEEISTAMSTLANYGILGMGLGMGGLGNIAQSNLGGATGLGGLSLGAPTNMGTASLTNSATPTTNVPNAFLNTSNNSASTSLFGPVGSGSSGLGSSGSTGANSSLFGSSSPSMANERYGSSPMLNDTFSNPVAPYPSAAAAAFPTGERSPSMNQNSFGLGTGMYSPTEDKAAGTTKQEIEVPESIVGAILGPGGKGIVEIQQYTGSNIQISKKGVYSPGTRNRIVSITGTPSSITKAQYMIQQRIHQEEFKRARQASTR